MFRLNSYFRPMVPKFFLSWSLWKLKTSCLAIYIHKGRNQLLASTSLEQISSNQVLFVLKPSQTFNHSCSSLGTAIWIPFMVLRFRKAQITSSANRCVRSENTVGYFGRQWQTTCFVVSFRGLFSQLPCVINKWNWYLFLIYEWYLEKYV